MVRLQIHRQLLRVLKRLCMKISVMVSLHLQLYLEKTTEFLKHFQNNYSITTQEKQETAEKSILIKKVVFHAETVNVASVGDCTLQSLTNTSEINIALLNVSASAMEFHKFLPNLSFII